MDRPTRSMTGIEKCIQVKKANELKEEISEALLEAITMVKTKNAYGKKK